MNALKRVPNGTRMAHKVAHFGYKSTVFIDYSVYV